MGVVALVRSATSGIFTAGPTATRVTPGPAVAAVLQAQLHHYGCEMNVVFLSPDFPPNWFRFVVALREAGAKVFGVADVQWESLRAELRESLTEYYRVDNLDNYGQVTRALGHFIARHGRIDRVDSLNEHWLELEARLRTDFNIPGINARRIAAVKRKSLMKRRFAAAGIPVARGRICRTPRALLRFIKDVGYPVVAKPDVGVGAARTRKLATDADFERYVRDKPSVDYIVEEFINGDIVTYDGLAGRNGDVVFDSMLCYSTGVMESVNEQRDIHYWIPRVIADDVRDVGRRMARVFGVRERPFHFEMFRTGDGRLIALEVNIRPPGGLTVDMFNWANDFDFYRAWANLLVHGRFDAEVSRRYACLYASRRDGRQYALSHEDALREYAPLIVLETRMEPIFSSAMGDHAYVLRGPDVDQLRAAAQRIQAPA